MTSLEPSYRRTYRQRCAYFQETPCPLARLLGGVGAGVRCMDGKRVIHRVAAIVTLILCLACAGPAVDPLAPERPILIVGLDGLEWQVMLPMMREGRLPVLSGLMADGLFGKLQTLQPTRSPVIWTTVATGKTPDKHGIFGLRTRDEQGRDRPFNRTDRKTKAIWNIFSDFGLTVHSVGWWMTDPAEKKRVWDVLDYDLSQFWPGGPTDPEYSPVRVAPTRIELSKMFGTTEQRIWRAA